MNKLINLQRSVSTLERLTRSQIAVLLSLGYSNRYIRDTVGVSDSEIQSVARETGIKRRDYRDGHSMIAQWVAGKAKLAATKYVKPLLLLK